jgi:uncharacterized Zn finger protein (UPF0148 family)
MALNIASLLSNVSSESLKSLAAISSSQSACFASMTPSPAFMLEQSYRAPSSSTTLRAFNKDDYLRTKRSHDLFAEQPILQRQIDDKNAAAVTRKRQRRLHHEQPPPSSSPPPPSTTVTPIKHGKTTEQLMLEHKQRFEENELNCLECRAVQSIVFDWKEGNASCSVCGVMKEKKLVIDSLDAGAYDQEYEEDVEKERAQTARFIQYNKHSHVREKTNALTMQQLKSVQSLESSSSSSRFATVRQISKTNRQLVQIDSREMSKRDQHSQRFYQYISNTWTLSGFEPEPTLCLEAANLLADLAITVNRTFPNGPSSCALHAAALFVVSQNDPRFKQMLSLPTLVEKFIDTVQMKPLKNEFGEIMQSESMALKRLNAPQALQERVQQYFDRENSSSSASSSSPTVAKKAKTKEVVAVSNKVRFTSLVTEINYIYHAFGLSLPKQYTPETGTRPQLFWEYVKELLAKYAVDSRFPLSTTYERTALADRLQEVQNDPVKRSQCEQRQPDTIAATIYTRALGGRQKSLGGTVVALTNILAHEITGVSKASMSAVRLQIWGESNSKSRARGK